MNELPDPDGVPSDIVARVVFLTTLLAGLVLALLFTTGWKLATLAALVASPIVMIAVSRRSARERETR
ncbi:MAG TPA: hypothetical protein VGC41_28385 [Kofleriaceae bacterium]